MGAELALTPKSFTCGLAYGEHDVISIDHAEIPSTFRIALAMGHGKFGFCFGSAFNPESAVNAYQVRNAYSFAFDIFPQFGVQRTASSSSVVLLSMIIEILTHGAGADASRTIFSKKLESGLKAILAIADLFRSVAIRRFEQSV